MLETSAAIRPAQAAEAGALHDLAALTFPLACPPSTTEAAKAAFIEQHLSRAAFERYLADPQRLVLVAERGDELVGYAHRRDIDPADETPRFVVVGPDGATVRGVFDNRTGFTATTVTGDPDD